MPTVELLGIAVSQVSRTLLRTRTATRYAIHYSRPPDRRSRRSRLLALKHRDGLVTAKNTGTLSRLELSHCDFVVQFPSPTALSLQVQAPKAAASRQPPTTNPPPILPFSSGSPTLHLFPFPFRRHHFFIESRRHLTQDIATALSWRLHPSRRCNISRNDSLPT